MHNYFAFEGPDGSGKTTQIYLLKEYLKQIGKEVVCVREPGGTKYGEEIRHAILKNMPIAESTLLAMYSARIELHHMVITPAIHSGKIVLSDRCSLSSWAYQYDKHKRTISYGFMKQLEELVDQVRVEKPFIFLLSEPEREKNYVEEDDFDKRYGELGQEIFEAMEVYIKEVSSDYSIINSNRSVASIASDIRGYVGRLMDDQQMRLFDNNS